MIHAVVANTMTKSYGIANRVRVFLHDRGREEEVPVNSRISENVKQSGKALFYPLQRRVLYRKPLPVDHQLMNELRHRFKPEVERLGEYLDRNFVKLWGYDHLE